MSGITLVGPSKIAGPSFFGGTAAVVGFTRVSRTAISNFGTANFNVTIPSTTSGNILIVETGWTVASCATTGGVPTDNQSSSYNTDIPVTAGSTNSCIAVYSRPNCAAGITSVAIQVNTVSNQITLGFIEEWSGVITTTPLDKVQTGTNVSTSSWSSGTTATLSGSADLAIGVYMNVDGSGTQTNTPTGGFGDGASVADTSIVGAEFFTENKTLSSTTGVAATGTTSGTSGTTNPAGVAVYQ
jgi:hypothetical protein